MCTRSDKPTIYAHKGKELVNMCTRNDKPAMYAHKVKEIVNMRNRSDKLGYEKCLNY